MRDKIFKKQIAKYSTILLVASLLIALSSVSVSANNSVSTTLEYVFDTNEFIELTVSVMEYDEYFRYDYHVENLGTDLKISYMSIGDGTPGADSYVGYDDVVPVFKDGAWVQNIDESIHNVQRNAELDFRLLYGFYMPGTISIDFDPNAMMGDSGIGGGESIDFSIYYITHASSQPIGFGTNLGAESLISTTPRAQVPEPETLLLVGIGIFSMGIIRRKRLKKK